MDSIYAEPLVELGASLTTLVVKGTVTAINSRIKAIREEKSAEKIRATYDEIVNELISEREEAVRIAQIYKNELEPKSAMTIYNICIIQLKNFWKFLRQ